MRKYNKKFILGFIFAVIGIILVITFIYFSDFSPRQEGFSEIKKEEVQTNSRLESPSIALKQTTIIPYLYDGDIFINDLNTNSTDQLTTYGYNAHPVLSPDGKHIAFLSVPKEAVDADKASKGNSIGEAGQGFKEYLYTYNILLIETDSAENAIQITNSPKVRNGIVWSPDSKKIAFEEDGFIKEYSLLTGQTVTIGTGYKPQYSHQGKLAYIGQDEGSIVIHKSEQSPVRHQYRISKDYYDSLAWSPDGKVIYFTSANGPEVQDTTLGIEYAIYSYNFETSEFKELASEESHVVSISPDGSYLYGIRGSYFFDAGHVSINFSLYDIEDDYTLGQEITLVDFNGPDYFEKHESLMYPEEYSMWLDDQTLVVSLVQTMVPKPNPKGLYILNITSKEADRLIEYK